MKNFLIALCALSIQLTLPGHYSFASSQKPEQTKQQTASSRSQNKREWRAATFLGLTVGKSNRLDMLRVLGEPKSVEVPDQTGAEENLEAWYVYDRTEKIAGELTVVVDERTNIVLAIDLQPHNLSKVDAVKHFGPDYIVTRYAFDDCLGDEESAPLYESASGPILEFEYRQRGIAVSINEDGKVNTISYVSKPLGSPKSKCKSSTARLPRK
jgi:hypothetical protein